MLSNYDLKRIAGELKVPLIDVVSKDELKNQKRQIGSWIINLQDEDKGSGSHWVFLKIFSDKLRDDNSSEGADTSEEDEDDEDEEEEVLGYTWLGGGACTIS